MLPRIRACHALRFTSVDRPAGTLSATDFSDPLVPTEWWRAAIGVADLTPPGPGKPITIVDSGVDLAHPEFAGRPNLLALNPQEPQPLGGVHGTAVASVIGARRERRRHRRDLPRGACCRAGTPRSARARSSQTSDIVAGILAAASTGAGVINLSLGSDGVEVAIQQAIETAIRKGMLVVAAAGNDGDKGSPLTYPAEPAARTHAAATDEQNQLDVVLEPLALRRPRRPGAGHHGRHRSRRQLGGGGRDELRLAARRGSGRVGLDGTPRARREPAVRGDAPLGHRYRTRRAATTQPATACSTSRRRSPIRPGQGPARAERRHRLRHARCALRHRHPALTTSAKRSTTLVARLTAVEDPRDVYRVFVPARGTITVKTTTAAGVDLGLWAADDAERHRARPGKDRLARGKTAGAVESITYKNPGRATIAYLAVTLGRARAMRRTASPSAGR